MLNRPRRPLFALAVALVLWTAATGLPHLAAATPPCEIDGIERIVAVGDVHGAYDRFVAILRTAGIIDERLHWAAGKTHLVQLGDVLDRGPDSRNALDLLQRLEAEAPNAGGQVHALLGNHEVARMLGDLRLVSAGEYAAFVTADSEAIRQKFVDSLPASARDDALKSTPLGLVEMRLAFEPDGVYGKWLRTHQAVVKLNGVVFLHGGISPAVAALSCGAINDTVHDDLTVNLDKTLAAPLKTLTAREDGPLWYRGLAQQPDTFAPDVADILSKQQARAIVVGHSVVPGGRIGVRFGGTVVLTDTGMQPAYVPTGRASALEISHGEFTAIYEDRRDVLSVSPKGSGSGDGAPSRRQLAFPRLNPAR
jgi:hypothetical protein